MQKEIIIESVEQLEDFAKDFLESLDGVNLLALQGELGAGKTTFTQKLLGALGAEGPFTSPTFVIQKQYKLPRPVAGFEAVYHLDCYRVDSRDVENLGWNETISNPKNLVIVEWPEKIEDILPMPYYKIEIGILKDNSRKLTISFNS